MPVQSREQLKNYFRNGALVKEEYFADLIDSTVNKVNDNIETSSNAGLSLLPSLLGKKFVSFFKNSSNQRQNQPSFVLQLVEGNNGTGDCLSLATTGSNKDQLKNIVFFKTETLKTGAVQGKVGINTNTPACDLDVNGSIGMKARIGRYGDPSVDSRQIIADGKWHKLLTNLKGINSFEVLCAVCSPDGKYAMYYSVVMNAFGKNKKTKPLQCVYRRWWQRIQLRWVSEQNGAAYGLEIRTASNYKNKQLIQSRITKLWN